MTTEREIPIDPKAERNARIFIISTSLAIPIAVAVLYFMPKIEPGSGALRSFLNFLPKFNAINNGLTAVILFAALIAIRRKQIQLHKKLMTSALVLSVLFLLSYVTFHATSESTMYPKDAPLRTLYLMILSSHILISAIIVPLVLISYTRALAQKYDRHRKIAKITWPLWFYVALTGVLVYIFISPYYQF